MSSQSDAKYDEVAYSSTRSGVSDIFSAVQEARAKDAAASGKGDWLICVLAFAAGFADSCITVMSLPLSIQNITSAESIEIIGQPSAESQGLYSICFFVRQSGSILFAAAFGEAGKCIGWKRTCISALLGYSMAALLSLLANVSSQIILHILAQFILGAVSPLLPMSAAYMMDVSEPKTTSIKLGLLMMCTSAGFAVGSATAVGLVATVPGPAHVTVQYAAAGTLTAVVAVVLVPLLPDIRPAKRCPFDPVAAAPLSAVWSMHSWTPYMRFILLASMLQAATVADAQAYMTDCMLVRYYGDLSLSQKSTTVPIIVTFVFGLNAIMAFLCMRFIEINKYLGIASFFGILTSVLFVVTPSQRILLWILLGIGSIAAAMPGAFINVVYGQVISEHRGELVGSFKSVEAIGTLLGGPVGRVLGGVWLQNPNLQQNFPGFPALSGLFFSIVVAVVYVTNERLHGHQSKPTSAAAGTRRQQRHEKSLPTLFGNGQVKPAS